MAISQNGTFVYATGGSSASPAILGGPRGQGGAGRSGLGPAEAAQPSRCRPTARRLRRGLNRRGAGCLGEAAAFRARSPASRSATRHTFARLVRGRPVAYLHRRRRHRRRRSDHEPGRRHRAPQTMLQSRPASARSSVPRRAVAGAPPRRTRWAGDIYAVKTGDTTLVPLLTSPGARNAPALSPDGRWLAYVVRRIGNARGVRPSVPRRRVGALAGVAERGVRAPVGAERARAVLPQWTAGDGRASRCAPGATSRWASRRSSFRRRLHPQRQLPDLRRLARRKRFRDGPALDAATEETEVILRRTGSRS